MRKALVVGIDYYQNISSLFGCVNDAHAVKAVLERHADGTVNFGVKALIGASSSDLVERSELKEGVRALFADDSDVALFYFAGHGYIEETGGYLCAGDCKTGDDGLPLAEVMTLANAAPARNRIIILDSCHSGIAGDRPSIQKLAELREGTTILTASTAEQYAAEKNGAGVFTTLMVDALGGAAANLLGQITPGGVYAHVDQSLGPWAQRPVFKTNVKSFVSLRTVTPPIPLEDLQRIKEFFPEPGAEFKLDPSFEPTSEAPDPEKTPILAILQKYHRVNLATPVGATFPYFAAMEGKSMKLTVLGEHYRRLVEQGLI